MKKVIFGFIIIAVAAAGYWYYNGTEKVQASPYRFVTVEQGNLESVVSSTGKLNAVTTVQVGTQVSGIVDKIYVDFNDHVRKGQVVAKIDTTLLVSAIREARANRERNEAQLRQSQREYDRIKGLYDKSFITEVEYNQAQYNLDIANATVKSSEVNLERAQRNLNYATILSPIDGIVVERNVDVGQTVAASFSAPQIFLIANDLSKMQILASVDESDIGKIEEGQDARFTVQAYDDRTFYGKVNQVRLQSSTQENVVNYTVVIDVENEDGKLLPGMTATVDFLIETATDVLKVPNAALRFRATPSMMATLQERRQQRMESAPDSVRERFAGRAARQASGDNATGGRRAGGDGAAGSGRAGGGFAGMAGGEGASGMAGGRNGGRRNSTMLWYLDENGEVRMTPARTGITDGQMTEVRGRDLEPGMQIIAGVTRSSESEEDNSNPFQQNQQRGRRPGGF